VKVALHLFATLGAYLPDGAQGDGAVLSVPHGTTVADVVRDLRIPSDLDFLSVVNGHEVDLDRVLADGDVLTMFPPLTGGAGEGPSCRR
jgi:molybdopterin converting factor small subunit